MNETVGFGDAWGAGGFVKANTTLTGTQPSKIEVLLKRRTPELSHDAVLDRMLGLAVIENSWSVLVAAPVRPRITILWTQSRRGPSVVICTVMVLVSQGKGELCEMVPEVHSTGRTNIG